MNDTSAAPAHRHRRRALDAQEDARRRRAPVPVGKVRRTRPTASRPCCSCTARRWPRSRRSTSTVPGRPDSSVMDWFARARLRLLDASTWKATAARTRRATSTATSPTAPTTWPRRPITSLRRRGARTLLGVRHLVGRAARGAVRAAPSRARRAARARRVRLDRRRRADARAAPQEAAGVPGEQAPADRPRVRALDLRARSSGLRGAARGRRLRRCDPRARRLDAERHLHRHVLEAAGRRSGEDHRAHARPARPVRRHRGVRRPDRVLQAAAESGQAVHGAWPASRTRASSRRTT